MHAWILIITYFAFAFPDRYVYAYQVSVKSEANQPRDIRSEGRTDGRNDGWMDNVISVSSFRLRRRGMKIVSRDGLEMLCEVLVLTELKVI